MPKKQSPKIPVLMYHEVSAVNGRDEKIRGTSPAYSLPFELFRKQMKCILERGYRTIALDELINFKNPDCKKSIVITFDDGLKNNYSHAFPVLQEMNATATVFVITGFMGSSGYLTWGQLKEMDRGGITVQSHTVSHRPLLGLSRQELKTELEASKKTIEDRLGKRVEFLSLPHGRFNQNIVELAGALGYRAVCTSEPGYSHDFSSPAVIKRINVPGTWTVRKFGRIICGNSLTILPIQLSKRTKNFAKAALGFNTYRKLYELRYRIKSSDGIITHERKIPEGKKD
jgi:peptidoglycan/xylan/chitin deacetylase (PgdA/CDA1 family)